MLTFNTSQKTFLDEISNCKSQKLWNLEIFSRWKLPWKQYALSHSWHYSGTAHCSRKMEESLQAKLFNESFSLTGSISC